jgi:hypothetical protein
MWPFGSGRKRKAVVVFHIDQDGQARGAYFCGHADVLIIDERDPQNRVYRMQSETPVDDMRRKIGKHPIGRTLDDKSDSSQQPALNLHWRVDGPRTA